ncbi:DUF5324 family protein [Streptomyces sp. NPDC002491]
MTIDGVGARHGQVAASRKRRRKKHVKRGVIVIAAGVLRMRWARVSPVMKGLVITGILAGGAFAAWKWWDRQANPDWLVEPPIGNHEGLASVDRDDPTALDPEVQAKQAEETAERDDL